MVAQITQLPTPPSRQRPTTFSDEADAFLGALPDFGDEANALATEVNNTAIDVRDEAVVATNAATTATDAADTSVAAKDIAVTNANQVKTINDYWQPLQLGPKPAFPTMDNQGNPLIVGAEFFHTGLKATYKWDGATWVVGTNVTAGVSQVNSKTGAVTLTPDDVGQSFTVEELQLTGNSRKWLTASVFQDAVFALAPTPRALHFYTTNTTYTVPLGVSYVRFYIGGRGGDGGAAADGSRSGGGGGGFAFGDILVRTGDVVSLEFASGVATAKLNGVVMGTANVGGNGVATAAGTTAEGGVGGTASIHSSVVNGGAYPGGKGGMSVTSSSASSGGGGSCGSPLGAGFQGGAALTAAAGGAGIGGGGAISGGGGGAGEAGGTTYGGGSDPNGASRGVSNYFADPLLRHAVGPRAVGDSANGYAGCGGNGGARAGARAGAGGDFGGGGGGEVSSAAGGAGGLMGGGGGARFADGGNGGYGGGGGGGTTGGTGGAAFGFLYVPVARDGNDSLEMAYWRSTGERLEPYLDRQEVFANEDVLILNDVQP